MGTPLLVLVDYRGAFWSSVRTMDTLCSMDVDRLRVALTALGHEVEVRQFADLDLARDDLAGLPVLYTSSEDDNAHYKRYIEAVVFSLRRKGAHPIPDPELLMAHHNKVMMEMLRSVLLTGAGGQPASRAFGTFEELEARSQRWTSWPAVVKPASGAGSTGVSLARNRTEYLRVARRLTRSLHIREVAREVYYTARRAGYRRRSLHRRGVVIQQFLPGLTGDFKVLRYGHRFYLLSRQNRPNDFRASGGGLLDFRPGSTADLTPVLDAAAAWSDAIGAPFCSMDIAYDTVASPEPALIEFQCVSFGPVTAENSSGHYRQEPGGWVRVEGPCDLERVFAEAASEHAAAASDPAAAPAPAR
jgi:hypothetical protein